MNANPQVRETLVDLRLEKVSYIFSRGTTACCSLLRPSNPIWPLVGCSSWAVLVGWLSGSMTEEDAKQCRHSLSIREFIRSVWQVQIMSDLDTVPVDGGGG